MQQGQRALRDRLGRIGRRLWVAAAAVLIILGTFPFWGGAIGARVAQSLLADRLGVGVAIGAGRTSLVRLNLLDVRIGETGKQPLAIIDRVRVPFSAAWGSGTVILEGARFEIEQGGSADNVATLLHKLTSRKGHSTGGSAGVSARPIPSISIVDANFRARDARKGAAVVVEGLNVVVEPGHQLSVDTGIVTGTIRLRGGDADPRFGAHRVKITVPLVGLKPVPTPSVELYDGYVQPLPDLGLTGISGTVTPAPSSKDGRLVVALRGSYGGAREALWTATGTVRPPFEGRPLEMAVALRAARFSLDRVKEILPPSVLDPNKTMVDAALDLGFADGRLAFKGNLDVSGLNLQHEKVSSDPVRNLALGLKLDGTLDPERRRLELALLEGRSQGLVGRLSGVVELRPGRFRFTDGNEMPMVPLIDLTLKVPRIGCAKLLESIPGPIVPHLQGFVMQGMFDANVHTKIDYTNLDALELDGKVGIDGCKVLKAPAEVEELSGSGSVTQLVEIPSANKDAPLGATELMAFSIGPENPDFVPFDALSPYLVNSILTTEDGSFWRHKGYIASEFKTALRRNLAGGGFRLGASSITMQMVKNVLLSREKTLSRKLQELFLVWYLEKQLPKERILELYFNAIEFGPRIYGIGTAAKHYFGKKAADLAPLEGAFFSSILPSPKRRYIQYCHGQLYPPWDKYVHRILSRVHERGRLNDEEYTFAASQSLTFDLTARTMTEPECLAWVKKITFRMPEKEVTPEVEN